MRIQMASAVLAGVFLMAATGRPRDDAREKLAGTWEFVRTHVDDYSDVITLRADGTYSDVLVIYDNHGRPRAGNDHDGSWGIVDDAKGVIEISGGPQHGRDGPGSQVPGRQIDLKQYRRSGS